MLSVQQFLTKNGMTRMIFLVSLDEKVLKGKRFADMEVVKQKIKKRQKL